MALCTVGHIATVRGHTGRVSVLCWLGDSEVLVTGSYDGTAQVWSLGQAGALAVLRHDGVVRCLDWSGDLLATGSYGGDCVVWTGGGQRVTSLAGHTDIRAVRFSGSGRLLVTAGADTCRVWREEEEGSWTCRQVLRGGGRVVWRGEQEFLTGGGSGTIQHWRVGQDTAVQTLGGHTGPVHSLAWQPDTDVLASGGQDTTVRLWRLGCAQPGVEPPLRGHEGCVWEVAWGPGTAGSPAILASWDSSPGLRLWTGAGDCLHVLPCTTDGLITSNSGNISFSPGGLLACRGSEVAVWRARSGQLEARLGVPGGRVCWGAGGSRLAVVTQEEEDQWQVVSVFDTEELGTLRSLRTITLRAMAFYLRDRVGRNQEDLQNVLDKQGVPRSLHRELQLYLG